MAVTVYIPTPFRRATNNRDRVEVKAPDVRGLLDELEGVRRAQGAGPQRRRARSTTTSTST